MSEQTPVPEQGGPRLVSRWSTAILIIFMLIGISFGSWLSRLPAVRDHLGATTFEMSLLGLSLALGSLTGLVFAGRSVAWLGPRRTLAVGIIVQATAMPSAVILLWVGAVAPAAACLAIFGVAFGTSDVAMNVSGASAERLLGKPRMPLYHAGYSLGSVSSMGLGALAESAKVPVPVHLSVVLAVLVIGMFIALRAVPRDESATLEAQQKTPPVSVHTGPISLVEPTLTGADDAAGDTADTAAQADPPRPYSPWRDPRILIIGLIAMGMSLAEGTASDWLPLALTDGRGFANETAALTLGAFFVSMTLTRLSGSYLLSRFGRVTVLRGGALLVAIGVAITILVPLNAASVVGAVLWGVGCAFGFPIGISAAADDPKTAVQGVAAVSAIAYTAFLLGPMLIGILGERFGLLQAFWPLVGFAAFVVLMAATAREPKSHSG